MELLQKMISNAFEQNLNIEFLKTLCALFELLYIVLDLKKYYYIAKKKLTLL